MLCNQMQRNQMLCDRLLREWVKREEIADKLPTSLNRFHPPSIDDNSLLIDENAAGEEESERRIFMGHCEAAGHLQNLIHLDL